MLTKNSKGGITNYVRVIPSGEVSKLDVRGTFMRVKDCPSPVPITIRANEVNGGDGVSYTLVMKKFEKWFSALEFDEVIIENDTGAEITVELQVGYGDYQAEIISRTQASQNVVAKNASGGTVITDVIFPHSGLFVPTPIVPENLLRKRLKIRVTVTEISTNATSAANFAIGITEKTLVMWDELTMYPISDAIPAVNTVDASDSFITLEFETESTAAIGIRAYPIEPWIGYEITVVYRVNVWEENYSAI
jgi:hypothetical protein